MIRRLPISTPTDTLRPYATLCLSISFGDRTTAGQLSSNLLIFVVIVLLLESHSRGRARFHQATNRYQKLPGHRLGGLAVTAAFRACLLPLLLGFLLPADRKSTRLNSRR